MGPRWGFWEVPRTPGADVWDPFQATHCHCDTQMSPFPRFPRLPLKNGARNLALYSSAVEGVGEQTAFAERLLMSGP